jgi:hypothetical protein
MFLEGGKLLRLRNSGSSFALHQFEFFTLGSQRLIALAIWPRSRFRQRGLFALYQADVFRSSILSELVQTNLTGPSGFDSSLAARLFQTVKSMIRSKDVQSCKRKSRWEAVRKTDGREISVTREASSMPASLLLDERLSAQTNTISGRIFRRRYESGAPF